MWSNERFSIIKTTMCSIFFKFWLPDPVNGTIRVRCSGKRVNRVSIHSGRATTPSYAAARQQASGRGDHYGAAVALEGLQGVPLGALADQLRLLSSGGDVDRELDAQRLGDAQEHRERRVVLAALQPRHGGLGHLQALSQRGLAQAVLCPVGDHLYRDRAS